MLFLLCQEGLSINKKEKRKTLLTLPYITKDKVTVEEFT
jgi:hypothetical protein